MPNPANDNGPHTRYLLFGWLGVCFGLYLGYLVFISNPLKAILVTMVGAPVSMVLGAVFQDRYFKE